MSRHPFLWVLLLISSPLIAQQNTKEYTFYRSQGDSLYKAGDYLNAARSLEKAMAYVNPQIKDQLNNTRWSASCNWSLANQKDSAFYHLDQIANSPGVKLSYFTDLMEDEDLVSLQNDRRWNDLKRKMCLNAFARYRTDLEDVVGKANMPAENNDFYLSLWDSNNSNWSRLNDKAFELLRKGKIMEAHNYIKIGVEHFESIPLLLKDRANIYKKTGDRERALAYDLRSLNSFYKQFLLDSGSIPRIDSAINADFQKLSREYNRELFPTDATLLVLTNRLLARGMLEQAKRICEMSLSHFPGSEFANVSMANYFKATGDKAAEGEYRTRVQDIRKSIKPIVTQRTGKLEYDVSVKSPSCQSNCPVILFDAFHENYHTPGGRYKPFAELMTNDGFVVKENMEAFSKSSLAKANVAMIVSPQHSLSAAELNALHNWVEGGGSLLIVTDHDNFASDRLLEAFGIAAPESNFTDDTVNSRVMEDGITRNPRHIVFSDSMHTLGKHPIISGRNGDEAIKVVKTFSGRTIIAPEGSSVLLRLAGSATSYMTVETFQRTKEQSIAVGYKGTRVFGCAFSLGKGKIVALSEAAMLTVQRADGGFDTPGCDNKQFALNVMRWLVKVI